MIKLNKTNLIAFEIDKSLASIWEVLQLSPDEIKERKKTLMSLLIEAYTEFVKSEYLEYDKVNHTLIKAKSDFRKTKEMLGDFKTFITSSIEKLPIKEQIVAINQLTSKLLEENKDRIEQSKTQFRYLQTLYNELEIPQNRRGEFQKDEKNEYTASRLNRMNNKIGELQQEKTRRIELNTSLSKSIHTIAKKTEELIDDDIKEISQKKKVTSTALTRLEQTNLSLIDLDRSRMDKVRFLIRQIKDLYSLLAIDQRDWIQFSYTPTTSNISLLEKELEFLESQKDERLPSVIDFSHKEVDRLSEILQIPTNQRPKYYGNDKTEEARYYQNALSKLEVQANQSGLSQSNFGPNGSPDKNYMLKSQSNSKYSNHSAQTDKSKNYLDNSSQTEKKQRNLNSSLKPEKNVPNIENTPEANKSSRRIENTPQTEIHSRYLDNSPQTEIHAPYLNDSSDLGKKSRNLANSPEIGKNTHYFGNSPKNIIDTPENTNDSLRLENSPELGKTSRYSSNSPKNKSKFSHNSSMTDYSINSVLFATPPKKKTKSYINPYDDDENYNESKNDFEPNKNSSIVDTVYNSLPNEQAQTPSPKSPNREMTELMLRSRDPFYTYV